MNCQTLERIVALAAYGEASDAEMHALERHRAACAVCAARWQDEVALRDQLARHAAPPATAGELRSFRARLAATLDEEPSPRAAGERQGPAAGERGRLARIGPHLFRHWQLTPALATLLVVVGFVGGWFAPSGRRFLAAGPAAPPAAREAALFTAAQPPVRVDAVEPTAAGQVRVVFDTLERRTLAGSPSSPAMQQLLLFAAEHPLNPGVRLDSFDALSGSAADGQVRQTLLRALRFDSNPGVRLKALEALAPLVPEAADVRQGLVRAVLDDANPGVRAEAIAALTRAPRPDAADLLRQIAAQSQDLYVRLRCAGLLRQMNATVPANLLPLSAAPAPRPENQ